VHFCQRRCKIQVVEPKRVPTSFCSTLP
jgi:hypothetical protein